MNGSVSCDMMGNSLGAPEFDEGVHSPIEHKVKLQYKWD